MERLDMTPRSTLLLIAAALAAGLGLVAARHVFDGKPAGPVTRAVSLFQPQPLPDFSLRQSDGTQLVPGELRGHWTLVFLGFTHCPDVCPTTLAQLAQAQKQWEGLPETVRPRVLFVSVDPDRDAPDRIGEYAHAFHRDTYAATADLPSLERFTDSLGLVFTKVPPADGAPPQAYSVDHSARMVVLDPDARMAGTVAPPFDPSAIAADLTMLTKQSQ